MPPIEKRLVPSGITPLPCVARIAVQRLVLREQARLAGAALGRVERDDVVALLRRDVTPGPTSTTTPAPSWPKITGNSPSGSAPERVNSSVWQTPVALISTSTSPAFGPSSSTSSITSGLPASYATAARVFMETSAGTSARESLHEGVPPRRRTVRSGCGV